MKRLRWVLLAAVLSLVAAGAAVAGHSLANGVSVKEVAIKVSADEYVRHVSHVCTGADGKKYNKVVYVYDGYATVGDDRKKARIRHRTFYNVDSGLGRGSISVRIYEDDRRYGRLHGPVIVTGTDGGFVGSVRGWYRGRGHVYGLINGAAAKSFEAAVGGGSSLANMAISKTGHGCHRVPLTEEQRIEKRIEKLQSRIDRLQEKKDQVSDGG